MSFGYNRVNYGIHSICPFRVSDGRPYGTLKVLGGGTMTLSSEFEELFGGSSKFAWSVEAKTISSEWSATVKSMPNFLFELFLGATSEETAASSVGSVSDFKNILNDSVFDLLDGIASVTLTEDMTNDLKDGIYIVQAVSAMSVDLYALSDIEFKKLGATTDLSFLNEDLKINATPISISDSGGTTVVPGLGVEFTGGSGMIDMKIGDTARFNVRSAHEGFSEISIGSSATVFPEHRQLCLSQKRSSGDTFEIEMHRVIGSGMPIPFEEQSFAIPELSMKLIYDPEFDEIAKIRAKRA